MSKPLSEFLATLGIIAGITGILCTFFAVGALIRVNNRPTPNSKVKIIINEPLGTGAITNQFILFEADGHTYATINGQTLIELKDYKKLIPEQESTK